MQTFETRQRRSAAATVQCRLPGTQAVCARSEEIDITSFAKAIGLASHLVWEVSERERKSGRGKSEASAHSVILRIDDNKVSIDLRSHAGPADQTGSKTTTFPYDGTSCESVFWGSLQPLAEGAVAALNDFLIRRGIAPQRAAACSQ